MRSTVRDERGAALLLAIGFMVFAGAISFATLTLVTNGFSNRNALDTQRNRAYAADGGVEYAITQVRTIGAPGPGLADCSSGYTPPVLNEVSIHVDCAGAPTFTLSGLLQRNVVFTACLATDARPRCPDDKVIIRAQVNFDAPGSVDNPTVIRTWVQSWSVNG